VGGRGARSRRACARGDELRDVPPAPGRAAGGGVRDMSGVKSALVWAMAGAILGAVAASFIVPPMLSWYNEPGSISPGQQVQTLCNLPELIRYTSSRLIRGQLIGAAVGAVLF